MVVGHLAAAIALNDRNVPRNQHVFGFSRLALSKDRRVLYQPDFVQRAVVAGIGKFMHRLRDRFVRLQAKLTNKDFVMLQNNVSAEREVT